MTKIAFQFPGQGSQSPGMGKALSESFAAAREVFEEVDDTLGENLSRLMFEGPAEDLTETDKAQPALMTASIAVMRTLEQEFGLKLGQTASFVAGHSLGEYSALCAAGALTLSDTARLLRLRGTAMKEAAPTGTSGMTALLGLEMEQVHTICEQASEGDSIVVTANDNAPGQIVISGHLDALDRADALAAEAGAKRCVRLPVAAAFHSPLMAPAAERMAEALGETSFAAPVVPVIANVEAIPVQLPTQLRDRLIEQVTGAVRWRESIGWLAEHEIELLVEAGSGKVLTGLARRIDRRVKGIACETPADLEKFASTYL
ncbi:MAG: ACP S-malonyltransferase [Alphaproteobacteria bacterium]